ncbi:MAG: erythromycin esterase family protein [Thermoanaerobaculia bacterium]|nr:erythromycin esterase family protein [Thermoanaerobaculia bacterium]
MPDTTGRVAPRRARRTFVLAGVFALAPVVGCRGRDLAPTTESRWIAERAVPLRGIDPAEPSLDDLEPLRAAIGDARLVLLGEQTHGEGSTFLGKTRLVRFLHERMGFDVLAMESGLFACERAGDAIRGGAPARDAVSGAVFEVWAESEEFRPMVDYLGASARTRAPLELTGFDMQLTGRRSREELPAALRSAAALAPAELGAFFGPLGKLLESPTKAFRKVPAKEREAFAAAAAELERRLAARGDAEGAFLAQVVRSTAVDARFLWDVDFEKPVPEVMNRRDAQMAENLLWLMSDRYRGRKVVAWAATSHVSRRRDLVERPLPDPEMMPMGQRLREELGEAAYVVAFTSGAGRVGSVFSSPWDLAPGRRGSFEDHAERTGLAAFFLDLRRNAPGSWLERPVKARPMGQTTMTAPWPRLVDAFVFVRTAAPSRRVEEE